MELVCLTSGLAMPVFELVPFASSILGCAVGLFSLTLLVRDGALALAGLSIIATAIATVIGLV